jgi:hypothetical protein
VEIASRFAERRELRSRVFRDAVAQERRVFGAERARVGHGGEACGLEFKPRSRAPATGAVRRSTVHGV